MEFRNIWKKGKSTIRVGDFKSFLSPVEQVDKKISKCIEYLKVLSLKLIQLIYIYIYILLEYNLFTMLCYFQVYSKVTLLYKYVYLLDSFLIRPL